MYVKILFNPDYFRICDYSELYKKPFLWNFKFLFIIQNMFKHHYDYLKLDDQKLLQQINFESE